MAKLLFDLGHGGSDPGAVNGNRKEKNDVHIALTVGKKISSAGHKVDYTRTTDCSLSLAARSYMENQGTYDYFISFHRDSFSNASANGVTVYTYNNCSKGKAGTMAREIVNAIAKEANLYNRGVKEANFHVLRETKCSAVLIECGFISNAGDNKKFDEQYEKIATAIAAAILRIIGGTINEDKQQNVTQTVPVAKYRVKVNGKQIGAYANLDNAKREADKNKGIVYDMAGNKVYPYNSDDTDEQYRYSENGRFYPDRTINVRTKPTTKANVVATYSKGEYVNYDTVVIGDRYNWISYISNSGERRYMAIRDKKGDNKMWGRAE